MNLLQRIRSDKKYTWILLIFFLIVSFILKFSVLNKYPAPPGNDPGNYLTIASAFRGSDVTGFGLRFPPLFFLFLNFLLYFLDDFLALKIAGALTSTIIGIPFFFLVKKISDEPTALLSTVFFTFGFEFAGMPAWGGYGNLLGIFFLLWALYFLVKTLEEPCMKNEFLVGLFFALVVGTHQLVVLFFVSAMCVFVLFIFAFVKEQSLNLLKALLKCGVISFILSTPFVFFYYLMLNNYGGLSVSSSSLLERYGEILSALQRFFQISTLFRVIIMSLGLLGFFKLKTKNREICLLLVSLFLSPFVFPIFLPKMIWRVPTFLYISLLPSLALYLSYTLSDVFNRFARKRFLKGTFLVVVLSLSVVGSVSFVYASVAYLSKSAEYFHIIKDDELDALNWIKENTNRSDLILCDGGSLRYKIGWWVQGLTLRKCFLTEQGFWVKDFTFSDERKEAETASRILSGGDYILENGIVRIADSLQERVVGHPVIAIKGIGKYQNSIFINDTNTYLNFSTISNPEKIWTITLADAENKSASIHWTEDYGEIKLRYTWPHVTITRSATLERNSQSVYIEYEVYLRNATMREFRVYIWPYIPLHEYHINYLSASAELIQVFGWHMRKPIKTKLSLASSSIAGQISYGVREEYDTPYVVYFFNDNRSYFYAKIKISFSDAIVVGDENVMGYRVVDLLENYDIDYVLSNKVDWRAYDWLKNSGHFNVVFENRGIVIFEVKRGK